MSWLDALLGRIQSSAANVALGFGLNFTTNLRARFNQTTKYIDVDVSPGTLTATEAAPIASAGPALAIVMRKAFTVGGGGNDDTTLLTNAPYAFRILDVKYMIDDHDANGAVELRSATGGGGTQLSGSASVTATGTFRPNDSASGSVAAGGSVYMRRTGNQIGGEVVVIGVRV